MFRTGVLKRGAALPLAATVLVALVATASPAVADDDDVPRPPLGAAAAGFDPDGYRPEKFQQAAEELPSDLAEAIARDLDLTPAEYLAQAEAAIDAVAAVDALEEAGIQVNGYELDGVELVVYVPSDRFVAAVEQTGARVVVGEPESFDIGDRALRLVDDVRGGQPFISLVDEDEPDLVFRCSIGFAGWDVSVVPAKPEAITAGHCEGDPDVRRYTIGAAKPNQLIDGSALALGAASPGTYLFGDEDGWDLGLIGAIEPGRTLVPEVLRWGNGAGAPLANAPLVIRDAIPPVVGASLCRSGSTTGWRCGEVLAVDFPVQIGEDDPPVVVRGAVAEVCVRPGDSGGPAVIGEAAVGIISAGENIDGACRPNEVSLYAQLDSDSAGAGNRSARALYEDRWEPMIRVEKPVITGPGVNGIYTATKLTGTLPFGNAGFEIVAEIDGAAYSAFVNPDGSWQILLPGIGHGAHTFSITARRSWWDNATTLNVSAPHTGGWINTTPVRLAGPDRYATAVEISKAAFPGTAEVVFIATGTNYPDALAAGPAAAALGGPLLLTRPNALPAEVKAELLRLKPKQIIIAGSSAVVSSAIEKQLKAYASHPTQPVIRLGGKDRYETARLLVDYAFDQADVAFIATGRNFPDALSAAAAGASIGAPVLLVDGNLGSVDAATRNLLNALDVEQIYIAGSSAVVTNGIASHLQSTVAPVERLSGPDRYATALAINTKIFGSADIAFLADGRNFPDALAGSVLAGLSSGPMYIAPGACVPPAMIDHMIAIGVDDVTVFGSSAVVSANAANLRRC